MICNPYRHWGFPNEKDEGLEKYFDIELVYGSKYPEISDRFKKAFVKALGMLFEAEIF